MVDFPTDGTFAAANVAELLAPTLGREKSDEVTTAAVTRLGLSPNDMTLDQALAVLDELGRTPGMVGITARFARSRVGAPRVPPPVSAVVPAGPPPSISSAGVASSKRGWPGTTVTADDVAALLASALGADKAQEVVIAAVRRLGFTTAQLDKGQAMTLLDHLAAEPGVVGLCARFGKARLILRFAA